MFKNILNGIKADRLMKPSRRPGIQVLFGSRCALCSWEGETVWARLGVSGEKRTPSMKWEKAVNLGRGSSGTAVARPGLS